MEGMERLERTDRVEVDRVHRDMRHMDREHIDEHDLARRYLRGQLDPAELAAFEAWLLANPGLLAELEDERLANAAFRTVAPMLARYRPAHGPWLRVLPLAACVLVALLLLPGRAAEAPAPSSELRIEALRGPASPYRVRPAESTAMLIDVGPIGEPAPVFNLTVLDGAGGIRLAAGKVRADADGWLRYTLDPGRLAAGRYRLQVTQAGGTVVRRAELLVD